MFRSRTTFVAVATFTFLLGMVASPSTVAARQSKKGVSQPVRNTDPARSRADFQRRTGTHRGAGPAISAATGGALNGSELTAADPGQAQPVLQRKLEDLYHRAR